MDDLVIEFQNVVFSYGANPVLDQVSIKINRGEKIGIIGPNGEGKTTALKLAMGFLTPKQGTVLINGRRPKAERFRMGYVPQIHFHDKLFPVSVVEVVLMGAISDANFLGFFPDATKERAYSLLKQLDLKEIASAPFGSLSGGQAQKVLLARALMCDPDLLFLDEPTAHIDPPSEEAIFNFLNTLGGQKTILTVTHNFDAILRHMDRVLCFQKKVTSLAPKEVCKHFALGMYHATEGPL